MSDIHLGHSTTPTLYITKNMEKVFKDNYTKFKNLDILILAGDIFDKLLSPASEDYLLAMDWLCVVAVFCSDHKIKLRILEGTPSHDWKQGQVFANMLSNLKIDVDFRYVTVIEVEHIQDLGIDILYVPDEANDTAEETLEEVRTVMSAAGLTKVDIAVMHGEFEYQLPMISSKVAHNEVEYHKLVRYYIFIGHIHTFSVNGKIVAQGSFDRTAHNEEKPKGCVYAKIYSTGDKELKFIRNKGAMVYKTYRYPGVSIDDVFSTISKDIKKHKHSDKLRFIVDDDISPSHITHELNNRFPGYTLKVVNKARKKVNHDKPLEVLLTEAITITKDNITTLLMDRLSKRNLTDARLRSLDTELNITLNEVR